ncbi:14487_t:CDS:2, partial [Racocetra persica]
PQENTTLCKELLDIYETAKGFVVRHSRIFGILDLSGEYTKIKNLFTKEDWTETFNEAVEFKDINEKKGL